MEGTLDGPPSEAATPGIEATASETWTGASDASSADESVSVAAAGGASMCGAAPALTVIDSDAAAPRTISSGEAGGAESSTTLVVPSEPVTTTLAG